MGKGSKQTTGYWYPADFQHGIGLTIDKFLEVRGGSKSAWKGELTASGTIVINAPNLYGGEKDQGGIVGSMDVMFGESTQVPNPYLVANFEAPIAAGYDNFWSIIGSTVTGSLNPTPTPVSPAKISAWRGFTTVVGKNMRLGANNPYPQKLSYKFLRIYAAMAEVGDWYPEKAAVPMPGWAAYAAEYSEWFGDGLAGWTVETPGTEAAFEATIAGGKTCCEVGPTPPATLTPTITHVLASAIEPKKIVVRFMVVARDPDDYGVLEFGESIYDAAIAVGRDGVSNQVNIVWPGVGPGVGGSFLLEGATELALNLWYRIEMEQTGDEAKVRIVEDSTSAVYAEASVATATSLPAVSRISLRLDGTSQGVVRWTGIELLTLSGGGAINPAHWLYYLHAHDAVGREPIVNFNDTNWRASADKLHAEGFGICVEYDPDKESLDEHTQRICKLIGGSVSRSMIDGQLYLDLARGDYDIDDLPILTDDDVLEFRELPSVLDGAINSVSVKYFDPERKENIITPPDVDHALVDAFGMIHQVNEYLEIPVSPLAGRISRRDRLSTTTPTRAFDLVTKRKPYGWRRSTYFRAMLPKRGIADMVCILADKETGTLKSGAIRIKATQDIYHLPDAAFVEVEPGGDGVTPQTPTPITLQLAYEAPYTEAAQRIPRAELAAVPADAGYLQAVAADLVGQRDYTMMVSDAGGEYVLARDGEWCPVAETAQDYGRIETEIQLGSAIGLASVLVGSAGMWDGEIIRVDAKDMEAGTLTVGRACADTTPARHDPASRIWFYDSGAAIDTTEYTDGETVDVKLLSNTTSAQLPLALAMAMPVTFNQRIARPYPPAKLRLNTEPDPAYLFGEIVVTWVHRDRVLQADQLVDTEAATIGPEVGTTYTMRTYVDDVLDDTQSAIAGITASVTPSAEGTVRIEVEAVRGGLASWQAQVREFYWTPTESTPLMAEDGELITTESGDPIFLE